MKKYLVLVSFAGPEVGAHAAGEEIELTAEQARDLAPFIEAVGKSAPAPRAEEIETAMLEPDAETADLKAPRRKKSG